MTEDNKSTLLEIASLKKDLLISRIKLSTGDNSGAKEIKNKKKEIARLFTKLNAKK